MTAAVSVGCPSGLAPPAEGSPAIDPSVFVREREGIHALELAITGARCAGCIAKIEGAVGDLPGVETARLNLSTRKLSVTWMGEMGAAHIVRTLTALGYGATPFDPAAGSKEDDARARFLMRCLAVAGFATANIMLLSVGVWSASGEEMGQSTRDLLHLISALIAIPSVMFSGRPFFQSALSALRQGHANMDVPISLAVFLALGVSLFEALSGGEHAYFDAAVMLLFFLLIGRWLDEVLRRKARSAARDLLAIQATTVLRERANGDVESVAAKEITPGDTIILLPGNRLPVNAEVIQGQSDLDLSLLTGEALPRCATVGADVSAGAINLSSRLTLRATSNVHGSLVADLARLIENGQQVKNRYTRLADKAAKAYVPIVHTLAALTVVGWLLAGHDLRTAVLVATAVLIITCPCALGLATPAVQIVATSHLFRHGILVKSGDALERLARIRHIVFDKTGTLTTGALRWTNREVLRDPQITVLAALARAGHHPIARAIAVAAGPGPLAGDVVETPGSGMRGQYQGVSVAMGRADFIDATGPTPSDQVSTWVQFGEEPPVCLNFEEDLRSDAAQTIGELRTRGIDLHIFSGDKQSAVARIAAETGILDAMGDMTPVAKSDHIARLKASGDVAMVGDGLNDTAALAQANVSLAPGSAAEASQVEADFVYQSSGVQAVQRAHRMSIRARRCILQNFAIAAIYNAIAAPIAMAGLVTPLIAALAMSGSSMVVTLNAMRLNLKDEAPAS